VVVLLIVLIVGVLGLLVGSHYAVYLTIIRALELEQGLTRRILLGLLMAMSLSFPVSILLVNLWRSAVSALLFVLASYWMALLINLLLAVALFWVIVLGGKLFGAPIPRRWPLLALGALAVLFAIYGGFRARHPEIRRIEVAVADLPEQWQERTIVQLSDLHLGHIHGAAFVRRVARQVNALDPDLVLVTGDLFDGLGGDFASFVEPIKTIRARQGVFFVSGNHEVYSRAEPFVRRSGLQALRGEVREIQGLQIVGVSYPGLEDEHALARLRSALSSTKPSILLFHTPTDILQRGEGEVSRHFTTYWIPDTSCTLNKRLGIDLQLSGHTHAGQIFPINLVVALLYRGRHRGLHSDGSFHLYVSGGTGTFGPPIRTAGRSEIVAITLKAQRRTESRRAQELRDIAAEPRH
jgi:predicted MPP superfamily phosphohydrolase